MRPAAASRARLSQPFAVAVFHRGGGVLAQRVFDPAVERDPGRRKRGRRAARAQGGGKPPERFAAQRRDRDRELGGFPLHRVEPVAVVVAFLEQAVARAQRAFQRRDPARMATVDRQHQAVEEAPPLGGRAREQAVHRRRQPYHPQMVAERGGGIDRLAVDPAAPHRRGVLGGSRVDPGAERGQPQRALDLGRHRPGAVALVVGQILQGGAAQPAPRRQQRNRLQAIGLAGAVGAHQHHQVGGRAHARRAVAAEMCQGEAADAGSGHGLELARSISRHARPCAGHPRLYCFSRK